MQGVAVYLIAFRTGCSLRPCSQELEMFAKGPMPGANPKMDALALLPEGTKCVVVHAAGMRGYSVQLPDGRQVGAGGNANTAWNRAHDWALRNATPKP
jgi:hypothetical protein